MRRLCSIVNRANKEKKIHRTCYKEQNVYCARMDATFSLTRIELACGFSAYPKLKTKASLRTWVSMASKVKGPCLANSCVC